MARSVESVNRAGALEAGGPAFPAEPPAGVIPVGPSSPVLGAPVGQAGTAMATEVIKLLAGFGDVLLGRLAIFDSRTANYSVLRVRPRAL